jgi:ABC-2 type transport system permease protein
MKMFAEEKRSGTLELLFTRPVREIEIVTAKFAAAWTLVILSILPTLLFYVSIYLLGSPPGNLDIGGTWGSYIGLIFLGGIYASIGIFSSSLTENQIVAFILAVLFSFLFYLGFSFISSIAISGEWVSAIEKFGIDYHYQSVSRGVIDSRDVIYFLSVIFLFLLLTKISLQSRKW